MAGADARARRPASGEAPARCGSSAFACVRTSPTKRKPLRATVRISFCVLAGVADRLARGVDAAGQRGVRHDAAAPDRGDQIILADDPVAIVDQIDQQVEDLRLDGNERRRCAAARAGRYRAYSRQREIARSSPFQPVRAPLSSNNQVHLRDKSRAGQGLPAAFPASSALSAACAETARIGGDHEPTTGNRPGYSPPSQSCRAAGRVSLWDRILRRVLRHASSTPSASSRALSCRRRSTIGAGVPTAQALIVDLLLMSVFAIQHSVMARKQFKQWWTQVRAEIGRAQHLCAVRRAWRSCCCSGSGGRCRRSCGRSPIRRSPWR